MQQLVLPFFEQEVDALRVILQERTEQTRIMAQDIQQLRQAVVALGTANLEPNDPALIRARQIYNAIVLVDGIGGERE